MPIITSQSTFPGQLQDSARALIDPAIKSFQGRVLKANDTRINPATEEKQDAGNTILTTISGLVGHTSGDYTAHVSADHTILSGKGVPTHMDVAPTVIMESQLVSTDVVTTISTANSVTDAVQVFRASYPNLHDAHLYLDNTSAGTAVDTFESYTTTTNLRATWSSNDLTNTVPTLDTTIFHAGAKAMRIATNGKKAEGDTVTRDLGAGSQDWSASSGISFWGYSNVDSNKLLTRLQIEDTAGNKASLALLFSAVDTWQQFSVNFGDMAVDTALSPDPALIRYVRVIVDNSHDNSGYLILDDISRFGPLQAEVRVYALASATPTTLPSPMTLADGGTSHTIELIPGKREYDVELHSLPTALTIGNYYAVGIRLTTVGSNSLVLYGSGSGNTYTSGGAFTSNDSGTTLTALTNKDVFFLTHAHPEARITAVSASADAAIGGGKATFVAVDAAGKALGSMVYEHPFPPGSMAQTWSFAPYPWTIPVGGSVRLHWDDDASSPVSEVFVTVDFLTTPHTQNG